MINVKAAADLIKAEADNVRMRQITEQTLAQGGADTHRFTWDGVSPIRVTLCWTDPAGASFSTHDNRTRDLTNDLNLKLTSPTGVVHRPFIMPYVGDWTNAQLTAVATTGINTVDNVEQVLVSAPTQAGEYAVTVDHTGSLTFGSQGYSLIINGAVWPAALSVTPEEAFAAAGSQGRPFSPATKSYQLSNASTQAVSWTAGVNQPWLQASPASGTLALGQSVSVTVSFNSAAAGLQMGNYAAEISFTNTVNTEVHTRQITLAVSGLAPGIVVKNASDQVLVNGSGTVSFGSLPLGGSPADALMKLGNSVPGTTLNVEGVSFSGADADAFSLVSSPLGAVVTSANELPFLVRFSPRRTGSHVATLSIASNDPEEDPFTVLLSATAMAAPGPAQTISVGRISPRATNGGPFQLPAVATSGLPLTYTLITGPATVNADGLVTPNGTGAVTLQISQPGDGQYLAATPVTVTFVLTDQPFQFAKVRVSKAGSHTLAVGLDGRLWSWGTGLNGPLGHGASTSRFVPQTTGATSDWAEVHAGVNHSVALKADGNIWAWGVSVGDGTTSARHSPVLIASGRWISLSANYNHTLAIKEDGALWGWGFNTSGQVGDGNTVNRLSPIQIGTATDWQSVSTGTNHSLAIKRDGTLWAWGSGASGQLGRGITANSTTPVQVGSATDWKQIVAGGTHSLAIRKDGTLWAWGGNGSGQLGTGSLTASTVPIQIGSATDWVDVDASVNHSVALKRDGTAWAWGRNSESQVRSDTQVDQLVPFRVNQPGEVWRVIQAGIAHTVAMLPDGSLLAWGDGSITGKVPRQLVRAVGPAEGTNVRSGTDHTLVTRGDGTLWGFGSSRENQMGNNSNLSQDFKRIGSLTNWRSAQTGHVHSGGIQQNGSLWMWGTNSVGQLGDGTTVTRSTPTAVAVGSVWRELSLGASHSVAIRNDNTLWAWGSSSNGELGDGVTTTRTSPVQIGSDTTWAKIATGNFFTLALKADGSLWATGGNLYGQLGLGDSVSRTSFVRIGTDTDWAHITVSPSIAAGASCFALKTDGSLWTWGSNSSGQLGLGNTTNRNVPVRVGADTDWKQVACNVNWTAAVKQDGSLWTWGDNLAFQQGVTTVGSVSSPRRVGNSTGWVAVQAGNLHIVAMRADGSLWTAGSAGSFRLTSAGGRSAFVQAPILPALQPQTILPLPTGFRSGRILSSSGLPVELEVTSGNGSVSGDVFTHTGAVGSTAVILAWQRGDETAWNAALPTQFSVTTQGITFPVIAQQTCLTPLVLNATTSSGLPVSYTITSGANIATMNGNTVSFSAAGTVTIQASQAGSADFAAADPVSRTFTVVKAEQTIAFSGQVPSSLPYTSTLNLNPASSRGLTPVVLAVVSGPGMLNGSQLSFTRDGVVVVRASQAGNDTVSEGVLELEITAFNTAPIAQAGSFTENEDVMIQGTAQAEDAENTPLSYALVSGPNHGALTFNPNTGAFSYTPEANYFGGDHFSFKVNDGLVDSNTATVTLSVTSVNDRPVASAQTVTTPDHVPVSISLTGQDVETAALQFALVTPPAHGTLAGSPPGLVYTSTQGYSGPDSFTFAVSDGELTSLVAAVSIQVSPVGITFIRHPLSKKINETESATFEVEVTGSDEISYQWLKDEEPLLNQTGPVLALSSLTPAQAGVYQVRVTNPVGTVLSQAAELSVVGGKPEIQVQPQHQLAAVGTEVVMSVQAMGKPPLRYQWQKDGKAIRGATQAALRLPAVQLAQAGAYTVVVTATESSLSEEAQVGVAENSSKKIIIAEGGKTSWSVKTAGKDLALSWTQDGELLLGNPGVVLSADAKMLSVSVAAPEAAGRYVCAVSGPGGEVAIGPYDLVIVSRPPDITPLASGDALPPTIVGEDYEFEVLTSEDEHRPPASFAASGLPPGLKINALTGLISGRVTASKITPYQVKITAKNLLGSDVVNVTLLVKPLPEGSVGTFVAPIPRHVSNGGLGGRLDLVTTLSGSFSGKLTLGSRKPILFKGGLLSMSLLPGRSPVGSITLSQPSPLPALELCLVMDPENSLMTVTLTDDGAPLVFEGWKNTWNTRDNLADAFDGLYNLGLIPVEEEITAGETPEGTGFASVTISKAGSAKLAGKTADGETILGSTFLGPQGQLLVYQTMYAAPSKGSLLGTLRIQTGADAEADQDNPIGGGLSWSRPVMNGRSYPRGFGPLALTAVGQRYLPPVSPNLILGLTDGPDNAKLRFSGAEIEDSGTKPDTLLQITSGHKWLLQKAGTEKNPGKVTLKLNAKTGQISGAFLLLDPGPLGGATSIQRKSVFEGLIYHGPEGLKGYGYFLLPSLPETPSQPAASAPILSGQMRLESP